MRGWVRFIPMGRAPSTSSRCMRVRSTPWRLTPPFYAIPAVKTVRGWASRVGDDFQFALKLPQEITHELRLRSAEDLCRQFFDVLARELGKKLGPILIQLGPDFWAKRTPRARGVPADAPR